MAHTKVHILFTRGGKQAVEQIRQTAQERLPQYEFIAWHTDQQFIDGLSDAEYLLALSPPPGHWAKASRLKLLHNFGAGVDDFLPADDMPDHVTVANAKGITAEPMSDYALSLVLMLTKGLHTAIENQKQKIWQTFMPRDIPEQTLGIMGLGAIGTPLARKARDLGFRVVGLNHTKKENPFTDGSYGLAELDAFLSVSDIVVILLPKTPETENLLDRERLAAMKPQAMLVNLGRGGIVDEQALLEKLTDGSLSGAAFDVFAQEPLPDASPLWTAPNLIITPHTAGLFPNYIQRLLDLLAQNIARVQDGKPVLTPVDLGRGY